MRRVLCGRARAGVFLSGFPSDSRALVLLASTGVYALLPPAKCILAPRAARHMQPPLAGFAQQAEA